MEGTLTVSILNNITEEERQGGAPEAAMTAEYKAGPRKRRPTHPGTVLAGELEALGITPYAAGPLLGISKQMVGNVIAGKSAVSPEMALRLGKFFGNGPEIWLGLQADVDLWDAREKIAAELVKIKPAPRAA